MYDVIIVGARTAGAPTALLAARKGLRVLVIDKAAFPCDALGTHFLHPRGAAYLMKWGVWNDLLATNAPCWDEHTTDRDDIGPFTGAAPREAIEARYREVTGSDLEVEGGLTVKYSAPRRKVLDHMLLKAAVAAGAELRERVTFENVLWDGDRVVGIRGTTRDGTPFEERAKIVVGADGRHSRVATVVKAEKTRERPDCTFCYWSYWDGLPVKTSMNFSSYLCSRGRLGAAAFPTNDGATEVIVMGPKEWFSSFKKNVEQNYLRVVDFCMPKIGAALRDTNRVERILGTVDQPQHFYGAQGRGWALVGDAGYCKDQITAIGMTHAFRDADLLGTAIVNGLGSNGGSPDAALADYEARRNRDAVTYFDYVCERAKCNVPRRQELELLAALRGRQDRIHGLLGAIGDAIHVDEFFSASNVERMLADADRQMPEPEILREYDARAAAYVVAPWTT